MEPCHNVLAKQKLPEDYLNFIKKSTEMQECLSSQVLIEKEMKAATDAFIINKNIPISKVSSKWNFKSVEDNFQAHQPRKAKKGFMIHDILDS